MAVCTKCGAAIPDGSGFCNMCGQQISADTNTVQSSSLSTPSSREDDISLANTLSAKYAELEKIHGDITDTEFAMKKCEVSTTPPRYSTFRFFWPFFIIALGVCFAVTLIASLIAVGANSEIGMFFAELLGYLSVPATLVVGIFIAIARRNAANRELEAKENILNIKNEELHNKVVQLRKRQGELSIELDKYKSRVPSMLRNKNQMLKIKTMLETGKAQSFDEAVEMIMHPKKA